MNYILMRARTPMPMPVVTLAEPLKPIAPKNPTSGSAKFTATPHTSKGTGGKKTGGVSTPHSGTTGGDDFKSIRNMWENKSSK
jgi:hypothetical protein